MREILIQNQLPLGCASACMAMLVNRPVAEVTAEFHEDYMSAVKNPSDYLQENGIESTALLTEFREPEEGKLYLIVTPSLNIEAATHQVIMDWRDPEGGCVLFDPNQGVEGKKWFVNKWPEDLQPGEVVLKGYVMELEVHGI